MNYQREYTTPPLSPQALEALHAKYSRKAGHDSLSTLSQGQADILYLAAEALGWPTITSLAHKYYPLYPNHKWWKRALERCARQKIRTATLNIVYLLRTLETVRAMALKAAFSGAQALNRLIHTYIHSINSDGNRLVPQGGIVNVPSLDKELCTLVKWFRANEEHNSLRSQAAGLACPAAR